MKNQNIKLIFLFLLALLISCGDTTTDSSSVNPIINTPPSFSIVEKNGNPVELTISNHNPSKALVGTTEWMSSNINIATVTNGVVRFAATSSPTNVTIVATIGEYSTNKVVSIDIATVDSSKNIIAVKGSLTNLIISESTTDIARNAYTNKGLTSVIIPDSVINIGYNAFAQNQLTRVIIPDSVTDIGVSAFENNRLTRVIIGNSVENIGTKAFFENSLTNVIIGNSVRLIYGAAFMDNGLTRVIIPDSVTDIGVNAFRNNQLTRVIIGNSVENIGLGVFRNNQLTSIAIPDSVKFIGEYGFTDNPSLTNVTLSVNLYTNLGESERRNVFGTQVQNWYKLDGTRQ